MRIELAMASSLIEGRYILIVRDKILLKEYDRLKKQKPDDILYSSQLAGHNACNEDDYETIEYEAGMLALFMNKKWKYLLDFDFCIAAKQAKRLGLRIPTNTNKAFKRRKKRNAFGKRL